MLKTLDKALMLLNRFTVDRPTWGVRELAAEADLHHSEVHRVLVTFADNGFLVKDAAGRYALGLKLFELGHIVQKTFSVDEVIEPALKRLAQESGETAFLSVLDGHDGLCINVARSPQTLRFSIDQGQRFALIAGSHAKAILAFQGDAFRKEVCDRAALKDVALLERQLAQIRADGWAATREEAATAVAGVSVPIRSSRNDAVIGSLSIAGQMHRFEEDAMPRLLGLLKTARSTVESAVALNR